MSTISVSKTSAWTNTEVEKFLSEQLIPVRLCCNGNDGYPLICSMWYAYDEQYLWCAVHESALLSKLLAKNNKVAFEVAPNDMPYRGVRGHGVAELVRADAAGVLSNLLQRYKVDSGSNLAKWLMGRKDEEYAIKIKIEFITSWDFTERMSS